MRRPPSSKLSEWRSRKLLEERGTSFDGFDVTPYLSKIMFLSTIYWKSKVTAASKNYAIINNYLIFYLIFRTLPHLIHVLCQLLPHGEGWLGERLDHGESAVRVLQKDGDDRGREAELRPHEVPLRAGSLPDPLDHQLAAVLSLKIHIRNLYVRERKWIYN